MSGPDKQRRKLPSEHRIVTVLPGFTAITITRESKGERSKLQINNTTLFPSTLSLLAFPCQLFRCQALFLLAITASSHSSWAIRTRIRNKFNQERSVSACLHMITLALPSSEFTSRLPAIVSSGVTILMSSFSSPTFVRRWRIDVCS